MRGIKSDRNQNGLAAIIVATVIMVILSLITVGFARLMRREQRQSLDRTLSTQAFYAAESAVNDAVRRIQDEANPLTSDKTSCSQDATFTGTVDGTLGSSYTCLLIDQAPPTLEYTQGSITTTTSKVIPIRALDETKSPPLAVKLAKINIAWEDPSLTTTDSTLSSTPVFTCPAGNPTLPTFTSWNSRTPGMLRIDIIPADLLDRASLLAKTASFYVYPTTAGCSGSAQNKIVYSTQLGDANKGQIIKADCTAGAAPRDCQLNIEMDAANQNFLYYVRVRSIYRSSDMTVRVYDATDNQLSIRGAQVQIDATGKVNDVLRRVQVRVPVTKSYPIPEFVLQTTDSICKQLEVAPAPANIVNNSCPL